MDLYENSQLVLWQAYCDKKEECSQLQETIDQLQSIIDNLSFQYGDAWYDGFMEAFTIEKEDGNLDEYDVHSISLLSEEAEQEWVLSKIDED